MWRCLQQDYTLHSKSCQGTPDILHKLLIYVGNIVRSNSLSVMTRTLGTTCGNPVILSKVISGSLKWPRGQRQGNSTDKEAFSFSDEAHNSYDKRTLSNKTGIQDKCLLFFVPRDGNRAYCFPWKGISLRDFRAYHYDESSSELQQRLFLGIYKFRTYNAKIYKEIQEQRHKKEIKKQVLN